MRYSAPNGSYDAVEGEPLFDNEASLKAGNGRFRRNGFKDVWATVAFFLGSVGIFIGMGIFIRLSRDAAELLTNVDFTGQADLKMIGIILGVSSGICIVCSMISLVAMRMFPRAYIITMHILVIMSNVVLGAAFFAIMPHWSNALPPACVVFCIAIAHSIWLCFCWNRIPLSAILVQFASTLIFRYPASIFVSFMGFVASLIYWIAGILCFAVVLSLKKDESSMSPLECILSLYVGLMLYWGSHVAMNLVHVTVSGVSATVYFLGTCMPSNPTWKSFVRAVTTSFGSICLGSFLLAVIQLLCNLIRFAVRSDNVFLVCCADYITSLIENLAQWFNMYAFTYIAIYGESYINSAKKAWTLISSAPCAVIFNDALIDSTTNMTAIGVSVASCATTFFILHTWIAAVVSFVWSLIVSFLLLRILDSHIHSLYVCIADAPDALQYSEPELHSKLQAYLSKTPIY